LIVLGTTGESSTLTSDERKQISKHVIKHVNNRIPVILGTNSNSTQVAIEYTEMALHEGADAALIMTPGYIKPTQEGLYQHYKLISEKVPLPQILYNVPGRTACDLLPETVERLSEQTNIIGIKEASGDIERVSDIFKRCGESIDIFTGCDEIGMETIFAGGKGDISVTANVHPKAMAEMCHAALNNDRETATKINDQLMPLHEAMFLESNPIPVKWALHEMGMISETIRLPMTPLAEEYRENLREILKIAGVL